MYQYAGIYEISTVLTTVMVDKWNKSVGWLYQNYLKNEVINYENQVL